MRSAREGALALAAELRAQDGTAAAALRGDGVSAGAGADADQPGPAQVAAAGPRAQGREREYELLIEMIQEGARLHYGQSRVVDDADADLALLLGDQLYAMGLSRLTELGDLEAVAELADLISLLAQAELQPGSEDLAAALWAACATAVGWGASDEHEAAKELARTGDGAAVEALVRASERRGS
jgi:hypothetical protein